MGDLPASEQAVRVEKHADCCMFVGSASYVSAKRLLFAPRTNSNNPYGVSGPLGAGARAVTGALDRVFASTDGHATCSNVVERFAFALVHPTAALRVSAPSEQRITA